MRSAKAPTISAVVMQANVIWKQMKTYSGIATPTENVSAVDERRPQEHLGEAADERVPFGEGEAVAVDHPDHRHDADDREHLREHRQHVLGADEAAVEQRQARHVISSTRMVDTIIQAVSPLLTVGFGGRRPAPGRDREQRGPRRRGERRKSRANANSSTSWSNSCSESCRCAGSERGGVGFAGANADGVVDVETKILPSPIWPVLAAAIASTTLSAWSVATATSILILGRKLTAYSVPR
jgi:hypothetical protein